MTQNLFKYLSKFHLGSKCGPSNFCEVSNYLSIMNHVHLCPHKDTQTDPITGHEQQYNIKALKQLNHLST